MARPHIRMEWPGYTSIKTKDQSTSLSKHKTAAHATWRGTRVGAKNYKPQATKQPASPDPQSAVRYVPLSPIAKLAAMVLYSHSAMSFSR
jgi:hypothetical protein